jgi:hypothetical protein
MWQRCIPGILLLLLAGCDAANSEKSSAPLLAQLADPTDCTVRCDGPPPGPSCVVYCPKRSTQDQSGFATERCAAPHVISDSEPSLDMSCWAPPASWCADGAGLAITEACTPDDAACCSFASTCIPCGWVSCREQGAPAFCEALVREDPPPGAFDSCPAGQHQMFECIVCGSALVCPEEASR